MDDACRSLLAAAEAAAADPSPNGALIAAVASARAAVAGCPADAAALDDVLGRAGWFGRSGDADRARDGVDSACAAAPGPAFDARALVCALKAQQLSDLEHLGEGTYATCYKARDRLTGEVITLKRLRATSACPASTSSSADGDAAGVPAAAIREVSLLGRLRHPNIVQLRDVLWDGVRVFLVMEYADADLASVLAAVPPRPDGSRQGLPPPTVRRYAWQLLSAVAHAHAHRVLHRDLKPSNVLVLGGGSKRRATRIKVGDWGLARSYGPPSAWRAYTPGVVTLWYRAPEILLGAAHYSTPIDVWAAGCVLAEMAGGAPLFPGGSEVGTLLAMFRVLGTPGGSAPGAPAWPGAAALPHWNGAAFPDWGPSGGTAAASLAAAVPALGPDGADLLARMLSLDPATRISARAALAHPFFDGVRPRGGGVGAGGGPAADAASAAPSPPPPSAEAAAAAAAAVAAAVAAVPTPPPPATEPAARRQPAHTPPTAAPPPPAQRRRRSTASATTTPADRARHAAAVEAATAAVAAAGLGEGGQPPPPPPPAPRHHRPGDAPPTSSPAVEGPAWPVRPASAAPAARAGAA